MTIDDIITTAQAYTSEAHEEGSISFFQFVFLQGQLSQLRTETKSIDAATELAPPTAADFLHAGLKHMQDRASTYDKPEGERSMGKTVAAFNAITGLCISEEQGWLLMGLLKMVRSQQGDFKADNYEDEASYAGLRGECAARARGNFQ